MTIEKKSLITKINSIIHRLIWIIILLCGSFFIGFNSYETWKNRSHEVNLLSNVLADAMIDPLIFDRKSEGAARLKKFLDIPYIDNVCLYYSFGSLFLDYHKSNSLRCPDDINLVRSHFSDLPFSNLASIDKAGSNVGYVFIGANSHDIKAIITTNAFIILGFILATLGLGTLISRKLEHIILSPLISLKSVVTHITQENDCSHRVNIETDDEIGDLAMAFNRMLDIISEGDAALRDLNLALEDKVHERTEDLEYALKVKEDFLSNMSHEIRTPIHGVTSFTRLLVEEWNDTDDDMLFNYAQRAHKSGERLLILINNLLDMSKFEKGAVQLERKELLFSDLIQTVIAETSGVVEVKHEKLVFQPMANEPLVEVDEGRMAQVMTNLIGNAVKYSEKGTIRISQSVNPEAIFLEGVAQAPGMIISISDEGIGIPEDELVKIFDKFFESSLTKTKAGGTGLGLAISREIVKAHLGTIWAENNKNGIGSTFTFMFPLKEIPGVTQITEKYV